MENLRKALVFDNIEWEKEGDVGNNTKFYKEATVVRVYQYKNNPNPRERVADIIFDHRPDRISRAHFTWGMKTLNWEPFND